MDDGELDIACAGREIEDHDIEIGPADFLHELFDSAGDHRATPNHGLVGIDEESHGDEVDAVFVDGNEFFVGGDAGAFVNAEHGGDAGAVDVGVHQADAEAGLGEGDGEVGCDGGFSDATFSGCDGDYIPDVCQDPWGGGAGSSAAGGALRGVSVVCGSLRPRPRPGASFQFPLPRNVDPDRDVQHRVFVHKAPHRPRTLLFQTMRQCIILLRQLQGKRHIFILYNQILNQIQRNQILPKIRMHYMYQCRSYLFFLYRHRFTACVLFSLLY